MYYQSISNTIHWKKKDHQLEYKSSCLKHWEVYFDVTKCPHDHQVTTVEMYPRYSAHVWFSKFKSKSKTPIKDFKAAFVVKVAKELDEF